jgi:SAM-dependent methyltransferase
MPVLWKKLLVWIWNSGHRVAWGIGEYGGAIVRGRIEHCTCCGRFGPMLLRRRSIPPKLVAMWGLSSREAEALIRKETLVCVFCGAKLRARRLAQIVIESYPGSGDAPKSLREWATSPESKVLSIAEINLISGIHEAIRALPLLRFSDFGEDDSSPSEDLTRLSYADESFDLVLTSETLEHVPDFDAALREIHRVLKPGGLHIYTIPLLSRTVKTFARREIGPDGSMVDLTPPISHPGGDWGYPVFTEFGADVLQLIDQAGFATTIHFGPTNEDDLAQVYVSRRSR